MKDLIEYNDTGLKERLNEFQSSLANEPAKTEIKINKMANNSQYLPIEVTESKLDYYFNGLWKITNFEYKVVANEIVGSLQLHVFHPVAGIWIERTGAGAVMIQYKSKQNGGDGNIANIQNKITNTLVKDFPKLKTECLRNAAKSLGRMFGRNLNREFEDGLGDIDSIEQTIVDLKEAGSKTDLIAIWNALPNLAKSDKRVINTFTEQKIKIG